MLCNRPLRRLPSLLSLAACVSLALLQLVGCTCSDGETREAMGDAAATLPRTGAAEGPHASGKSWESLELSMRAEPPGLDGSCGVRLAVEGRPGETVRVLFFGTEGVVCKSFEREVDVKLDASGRGEVLANVAFVEGANLDGSHPCVVAQVTHEDGRVEETHCPLGAGGAHDHGDANDDSVQEVDGARVRITPSG